DGGDHVVASLNDGSWDPVEGLGPIDELFRVEEPSVREVVVLDAGEGKSEVFVLEGGGVRGAGIEVNGTGFPNTPRLGRAQSHLDVRVGQPSSVGLDEIAPFTLGGGFEEHGPRGR